MRTAQDWKNPLLCLNFKLKRLGLPNLLEIVQNEVQFRYMGHVYILHIQGHAKMN